MAAKTDLPPVPLALADAALVDGPKCAATGDISLSMWHELVQTGRAPQPVIRRPRLTRWRLADVRAFWIGFAESAVADTEASERVRLHATRASGMSRAKRAVTAAPPALDQAGA